MFQAAAHFCARLGFEPFGYRGLETGSRAIASHVVKQNDVSTRANSWEECKVDSVNTMLEIPQKWHKLDRFKAE